VKRVEILIAENKRLWEALDKIKSGRFQTIIHETVSGGGAFTFLPNNAPWEIAEKALENKK
jgi:hypothetical protein